MPGSAKLAAWTGAILALGGLAYAWQRSNAPSASPQDHVDEIFRPAPIDAVPCDFSAQPRPLMILVLGQSNAANHGAPPPPSDGQRKATFLFEGRCYRTGSAAPGATGRGGSIWTVLAPRLSRTAGRPVVFSVLAVEATQVRDWVEPGRLHRRLADTLASNRENSFVPDIVLWQQGEADARSGTSANDYRERFSRLVALLRSQGVAAPIAVALSTRCGNEGSEQVRTALKESAIQDSSVRLGPDTDTLTGPFRQDGCHFSASGLDAAAELWLRAIVKNG
jgi:hypothetical protein